MATDDKVLVQRITTVLFVSLAVAALALVLFSWLAEEVFTGELLGFDSAVRLTIHQHASPALTRVMSIVSWLGSATVLTPAVFLVAALFLLLRWRRAAAWMMICMAGAVALEVTLKQVFHRARPVAFFGELPPSFSFPSGHALSSLCFYGVLAGLLTRRLRGRVIRALIWLAGGLMVAFTGFSRIYLGVHWPTDVIAGYCAATVWVAALLATDRWRLRRKHRRKADTILAPPELVKPREEP
jgi:membrane-associated phospholipid phosphatase